MTQSLDHPIVSLQATLADAMRAIDRSAATVILVAGSDHRIQGLITDGDIRRALLGGRVLNEACLADVMTRKFHSVPPGLGRPEILDRMRAFGVQQLPELDEHGHLVGLHLLHRVVRPDIVPNTAVILAGGLGMRLRPLTEQIPKPMLQVAGRPILERLVLHLVGAGIRHLFLAISYLGDVIEQHFGDGGTFGCKIEYLRETEPLGTGGALGLLPTVPSHSLLVLNGDLVTQFDVTRFLQFHEASGCGLTIATRPHAVQVPFGVLTLEGNRVMGMTEKPLLSFVVNAGIYAISPSVLELIPRNEPFMMPQLAERCIERGTPVGAFAIEEEWADIGRPDELSRARTGS